MRQHVFESAAADDRRSIHAHFDLVRTLASNSCTHQSNQPPSTFSVKLLSCERQSLSANAVSQPVSNKFGHSGRTVKATSNATSTAIASVVKTVSVFSSTDISIAHQLQLPHRHWQQRPLQAPREARPPFQISVF